MGSPNVYFPILIILLKSISYNPSVTFLGNAFFYDIFIDKRL